MCINNILLLLYILNAVFYLRLLFNIFKSRIFRSQLVGLTYREENKIVRVFCIWSLIPIFNLVVVSVLWRIVRKGELVSTFKKL